MLASSRLTKGAGYLPKDYRKKTERGRNRSRLVRPLDFAVELQKDGPVQGNLDPMRVVAGGVALEDGIDDILQRLGNGPLIFNLGQGITPQADPENVRLLVERVARREILR